MFVCHMRPIVVSRCFRLLPRVLLTVFLLLAVSSPGSAPAAGLDPYPLDPPDTSSPRATLRSFLANMTAAHWAYTRGAKSEEVARPFRRAIRCLDLGNVADSLHNDVGGFSVLLLKEILDRVPIPAMSDIPGSEAVSTAGSMAWRIPRTEIVITRVAEGDRAGAFLFSRQSVARLPEYYERAKGLPYKPGATQGLLDLYMDSPGGQVPFNVDALLPAWGKLKVFERPLWKWGALFVYFALSVVAIVVFLRFGRVSEQRYERRSGYWRIGTFVLALVFVLWGWALDVFVDDIIGLRGPLEAAIKRGALVFSFCAGLVVVFALIEILSSVLVAANRVSGTSARAHFIRIVMRLIGVIIAGYLVVDASAYLGWAVAPVLAGLGVGGLAMALAARPTLENVIAGLILFADKPVKVGEFCRFGDRLGTVEEVGLRSTRIRSLERTLISVPNADFSQMQIENYARRDSSLFHTTIGLRYETTPDQLRLVLTKLREMLIRHPKILPDPARARFLEFGKSSLDIEIFAYVRTGDRNEYLAIREDLNLRIMDVVREAGTAIAFPAQTVYWQRDHPPDPKRRAEAEACVAELRARGQLPFPEFAAAVRQEMEDSLDYPPQGSPGSGTASTTLGGAGR